MRIADSRNKATGFLVAAALAVALLPAQAAYEGASTSTAAPVETLQAMGITVTGRAPADGYTVAMPTSDAPAAARTAAKPGK